MRRQELLVLLLGAQPLDDAAQWRDTLKLHESQCTSNSDDTTDQDALMHAIDAVVPHIPVFHDHLSHRIDALFAHCQHVYASAFARLVRTWLQRDDTSRAFRAWLVEWLSRSRVLTGPERRLAQDDASNSDNSSSETKSKDELVTDTQLWHNALCAALLAEEDTVLKHTLLRLLSEQEAHDNGSSCADLDAGLELASVEALLDFYWAHAHELAPFALLCATKLHALVQQQRMRAQLSDSVVVRLRWSKLFAPLLFEPLLRHCAALQVFPTASGAFDAHAVLQQLVRDAQWTQTQTLQLARLHAIADSLERACVANAVHVVLARTSDGWCAVPASKCIEALSVVEQQRVLHDLERDAALVPAPLLPHVLLVFGAVAHAIACDRDKAVASDAVVASAMQSLVALVEFQLDTRSCYLIAALVLQLRVARFCVWTRIPALFVQVVEALSTLVAVEASGSKRWLVRMLQQHLLFECDVSVLAANLLTLAQFLPAQQRQLLHLRCQS